MYLALTLAAPPQIKDDNAAPGLASVIIIFLLCVSLFLLIRSMNKQIGKIQAPTEDELAQAELERRAAKGSPADS